MRFKFAVVALFMLVTMSTQAQIFNKGVTLPGDYNFVMGMRATTNNPVPEIDIGYLPTYFIGVENKTYVGGTRFIDTQLAFGANTAKDKEIAEMQVSCMYGNDKYETPITGGVQVRSQYLGEKNYWNHSVEATVGVQHGAFKVSAGAGIDNKKTYSGSVAVSVSLR